VHNDAYTTVVAMRPNNVLNIYGSLYSSLVVSMRDNLTTWL